MALKARFMTDPNPIVGAVLIDRNGHVLSEGYHEKAGMPHAEVMALDSFSKVPGDATLFVTLEPCAFHGQTPPCTDLILNKKVKNIVIGCQDPNPEVAGKGIKILRKNGVNVIYGIREQECVNINRVFNKHIVHHLPYVSIKTAASLDGKIAMPSGESKWITGKAARAKGHQLRSGHQAIAVGSNTLNIDNPKLTDRVSINPRQPIRVVFSSNAEITDNSWFIKNKESRRIMFCGNQIKPDRVSHLKTRGVETYVAKAPKPEIRWCLEQLYKEGICSLLLEGGAELIASFIKEKMVDRICLFLSGKIIGSPNAPSWCGETGINLLADAPGFHFDRMEKLGEDLFIDCFSRLSNN